VAKKLYFVNRIIEKNKVILSSYVRNLGLSWYQDNLGIFFTDNPSKDGGD